jgi:hypothetical protein
MLNARIKARGDGARFGTVTMIFAPSMNPNQIEITFKVG